MSENFDEVLSAALQLSPGARAMLADHLLSSLDTESEKHIEAIWAEEAKRRARAIDEGRTKLVPGEEVMAKRRPIEGTLERAAEIRHTLEGRHFSDSTQYLIEDRQR